MPLWDQIIDVLRESMFVYAQATNGNLAIGIMMVTFLARLALFPLSVRMARSAAAHQAAVAKIQPEITALQARLKGEPRRLAAETKRLFDREGISMMPASSLIGGLTQMPVLLALFSAVRKTAAVGGTFLWVRDISRPDVAITVIATALTALGFLTGPQPNADQKWLMLSVSMVITAVTLWHMAAGVGMYWGVSSAVGLAQSLVVNRTRSRATA